MDTNPNNYPAPDQLADEDDELGWDREEHGRMKDHAASDDAVETVVRKRRSDA